MHPSTRARIPAVRHRWPAALLAACAVLVPLAADAENIAEVRVLGNEKAEDRLIFQSFGIMAGDDNLVRDVVFEDIRVDRIEEGKLFNLHIAYTPKYNTSPGRGIENVTLRNISYTGKGSPSASVIYGYDPGRQVRNIVIDNVTVAGKRLTGAAPNLLDIGPHASGVTFR